MRFFISHHQHKGKAISTALKREGWLLRQKRVDVALFDHYINRTRPEVGRPKLGKYYDEGTTIINYPHGATGSWWMDSDRYQPDNRVFANLVIGENHKYVEQITQPNLEHYVIGWNYCPIKEFQKNEVKNILFAPIHATLNGNHLREECIDTNSRVYETLLSLTDKYRISVRHLNPLDTIGLHYTSKVKFNWAKPDGYWDDIEKVDLVIAEGTYMYLAIARGKPVIGMNQHIPIRPNNYKEEFILKNWDKYGDYMAYPIDFDDGDIHDLIEEASNKEQVEWKKLFIGNQMDSKNLSTILKEIRKKYILSKQS
jgi:hypothetical protein